MWVEESVSVVFAIALFINAALFVPQGYRIIQKKTAKEISLTTFVGFWLIQLITVIYGYMRKDYILFSGYLLAMITCGSVIVLTVFFRFRENRNK